MLCTIRQIIQSIEYSRELTRTLGELDILRDPSTGRLLYSVGNSAVLFKVRREGEWWALKCYLHSVPNLGLIYGDGYLPSELYIHIDEEQGEWIDLVTYRWIEGTSLGTAVRHAIDQQDYPKINSLSYQFDSLALGMLGEEWAHGDLTLDNIVVCDGSGELRLIDFDGMFLPQLAGEPSKEIGTSAFQHPKRYSAPFDRDIDDYSIALISSALSLLRININVELENSYFRYVDGLLFDPQSISSGTSPALERALEIFARGGYIVEYRIAQLLGSPTPKLASLEKLLRFKLGGTSADNLPTEVFVEGDLWGYCNASGEELIPPIFSEAFDFREGYAAVRIEQWWHFIDHRGRLAINCSEYTSIKSFRNGVARVFDGVEWYTIDRPSDTSSELCCALESSCAY